MATIVKKQSRQFYWDCYDRGKYTSSNGNWEHLWIRLWRRYGDNLEYATNSLTIEFQRNLTGDDQVTVYGAHFDYLPLGDTTNAAKLITAVDKVKEKLQLRGAKADDNLVVALRALGFKEVNFRNDHSLWVN